MWRIAITLAVLVMMMTASTSRKLPNVSWPIESENAICFDGFGGNSADILLRPGSNRPQYTGIAGLGEHVEICHKSGKWRRAGDPDCRRPGCFDGCSLS